MYAKYLKFCILLKTHFVSGTNSASVHNVCLKFSLGSSVLSFFECFSFLTGKLCGSSSMPGKGCGGEATECRILHEGNDMNGFLALSNRN